MAAGAVYAALKTLRRQPPSYPGGSSSEVNAGAESNNHSLSSWSLALERHSGYSEREVKPIAMALVSIPACF